MNTQVQFEEQFYNLIKDNNLLITDFKVDVSGKYIRILKDNTAVFEDSLQHQKAVCELMGLNLSIWTKFLATTVQYFSKSEQALTIKTKKDLIKSAFYEILERSKPDNNDFDIQHKCVLCKSNNHKLEIAKKFVEQEIMLARCASCNLVSLYPPPTPKQLLTLYDKDYFAGDNTIAGYSNYVADKDWREEKARTQISELNYCSDEFLNSSEQINVLDVGSGFGYFRRAAEGAGWQHKGIEYSSFAVEMTKSLYGYQTACPDIASAFNSGYITEGEFDIITLWDVLEHFTDPVKEMSLVAKALKLGGIIAMRSPNIDCIEFDVFRDYYHSIKQDHMNYFSKQTLERLMEMSNFQIENFKSTTHILQGLLTESEQNEIGSMGKGADFFCIARKA